MKKTTMRLRMRDLMTAIKDTHDALVTKSFLYYILHYLLLEALSTMYLAYEL